MALPRGMKWGDLPWRHIVRDGLVTSGAFTIAGFVEDLTTWVMTRLTGSEWIGYACGLIILIAVLHGLLDYAREPWE